MHPTATMNVVHAICLTGGSAFGLAAAGGVMAAVCVVDLYPQGKRCNALGRLAAGTAVGAAAALAITRARRYGRLLDVGLLVPLGTSAVTIGLGMLITFDHAPFDWRGKWWLVPVGHSLVALPFVVRAVVPALRAIAPEQRFAAATLGASPWRTWWEIDIRRMLRPLASAAGFAAAISLGEFGATSFLTRAGRDSVPMAIDHLLSRAGDVPRAQAFALATLLLVMTATVVMFADRNGRADA